MSTEPAAGQRPPKSCEMPILSDINSQISITLVLNRMFAGGGPKDPKSYALVMNFIRIVDKLVVEYEQTRAALTEFISTPNEVISPIMYATNYCESCISTLIRAINLGRRIRRDPNGPEIARKIAVLSDSVCSRVKAMKNAIEHIDEKIIKNTWTPGEPLCLIKE
jgi:hypothetical protein